MRRNLDPKVITESILSGNRLALARACTEVENDSEAGEQILSILYPNSGKAHLVGVTGSPGTGKSSLVNQLAKRYRILHPDGKVAVIAVDPTSPFSGGAVLGDRVRMRDLSGDDRVFIRSMATRGALGGLSRQTTALSLLFDCAGYEMVFIETVGAGQSEVDIVRLAHTTIVVEAPGLGDEIQAIKAGIMEIADILVINKADHPGVEAAERALRMMLEMAQDRIRFSSGNHHPDGMESVSSLDDGLAEIWLPSVLRTIAIENRGIDELVEEIARHREWLKQNGNWGKKERQRIETDMVHMLSDRLFEKWQQKNSTELLQGKIDQVIERKCSPYQAVAELLD
jgi:LAO/AO transport system kinase